MALQDRIRSNGATKTLKELEEEWICPECEEFICVHTGTCKNQLKEDLEYDQMTLKEYFDPFTGEPINPKK